ncbi:MAG: hypothetical protein LBM98_11185 [Oscillospiraceae bacterium]|jgi:hypothetical protein|nr:hypothetical protein [Oscillospiraceae bacterium]
MRRDGGRGCVLRPTSRRRAPSLRAPPHLRYVGRLGARQSSAGSVTYVLAYRRVLRQPWIASPRINGTYRKCGGGFAKTGRAKPCPRFARGRFADTGAWTGVLGLDCFARLAMTGEGEALPCPGALRRDIVAKFLFYVVKTTDLLCFVCYNTLIKRGEVFYGS